MATEHLQIPDIAASQNQKEVTANAAHNLLDRKISQLVQMTVTAVDTFTTTETRENTLVELIGTPGATTIDMPDTNEVYMRLINNTDGIMTIRNSAGGGTGQPVIEVGDASTFHYDGTNFLEVTTAPALTFLDLTDTPGTYSGDGLKVLRVNSGATSVEFGNVEGSQDGTPGFLTRNELFHVVDEKTLGTDGGTSVAGIWNQRDLNATRTNEISGASLSSNQIILPAGTYYLEANAPSRLSNRQRLRLRNITDGNTQAGMIGSDVYSVTTDSIAINALLHGRFTITATKTFQLQHFTEAGETTFGLGVATNNVEPEVYADVRIWKAAGAAQKPPVRVASTVNGTLATDFENGDTMDGITLATGDRILLKDQSTGAENGLHVVEATGAPTRAADLDNNSDVALGTLIAVLLGTVNARSVWMHTAGTDIGTDTLTFLPAPVLFDKIKGSDASLDIEGLDAAQGGAIVVKGGASSTGSNPGGAASIVGGPGGVTGVGGAASLAGSAGGATGGDGGDVSVTGGDGTGAEDGLGGDITVISGGSANGTTGAAARSGNLEIKSGTPGTATTGTGGLAGEVDIEAAAGGAASGAGGTGGIGGRVLLTAGAGGADGEGGSGTGGLGGTIILTPGAGGAGDTPGDEGAIFLRSRDAMPILYKRPAPAAKTTSATLTIAELLGGWITVNQGAGASSTQTTPTGTQIDAAMPSDDIVVGDCFDFVVINTSTVAAEDAILAPGSGVTLVGNNDIQSEDALTNNTSGLFRFRRTGANLWDMFRIS